MRIPILHSMSERALGFACVLFSVCMWSGWIIVSSYSVRGSLTAFDITAIRFTVAGGILLPVLIKKGLRIGPYGRFGSFWLAATMGAPYNIIAIFGMKYAPASHASGIINTTMLLVTLIGSVFILHEKLTRLRIVGIILSLTGIGAILYARNLNFGDALLGHLMFVLGGTIWAGYALTVRAWKVDPLHAASAVCGLSLVIYMPIYLLFLPSHIGLHNLGEVAFQGFYQGLMNGVLALLFFSRAISILGASTSTAFIPLVPVLATILAIPFLGEYPNWLEWTGIGFAASGVLLATGILNRKRKAILTADAAAAGN